MSGGHFDYGQYTIRKVAESIEEIVNQQGKPGEYGYIQNYSPEVIAKIKEAAHTVHQAADMAQRVDWLVSGDDGEENFLSRWRDEVRPYWHSKNENK